MIGRSLGITRRRGSALLGAVLLALAVVPARAQEDPVLAKGIREVEAGQDLVATDTLQSAVRRLFRNPEAQAQLARAYLHLGVAWSRLQRPERATANFAEALAIDWSLEPPKALQDERVSAAFGAAREETRESGRAPASAAKKGGLGALGIAGIAGGVAGVAALTASAGGDEPAPFVPVDVVLLEQGDDGSCAAAQRYVGLVTKDPRGVEFRQGTEVLFRAGPAAFTAFVHWEGACASFGSNPVCTLTVQTPATVAACFRYLD